MERGKKKVFTWDRLLFLVIFSFILGREFYQESHTYQLPASLPDFVVDISTGKSFQFPPKGRFALLFWSTTCPPCRLEMKRLKSSIEQGLIREMAVIAVNPYEDRQVIRKFLKENPFPFHFVKISGIAKDLQVEGTPTIAWFDERKLVYKKTGVSLTGIYRLESFLKN